jgi:UDPglucose 6-dehydrogenase
MRISIIGLGFVGLSLAVTNATKGFKTIGVDNNDIKINNLKKGKPDFFEPQLNKKLNDAIKSKNILFTNNFHDAINNSDITFLTVGTPSNKTGNIDLKFIKNASNQIFNELKTKKKYHLVVVKSTLSPSTTKNVILPIFQKLIQCKKMDIVVNPEFLREGFAIKDLLEPHLIVIGSYNKKSANLIEKYYKKFYKKIPEIILTDISSAELIKYANNAFLATKISFINSIANICQNIPGTDVNTIANAIGKDPRIGPLFLKAGPGFGGSCLPKDLSGLINYSKNLSKSSKLFKAVKDVNDLQPTKIIKIMKQMKVYNEQKIISILGLAFKNNTDDIREAISIKIVKNLLKAGMKIKVHDPMAMRNFKKIFGEKIEYANSISSCLKNSNCCVILTEWSDYKKLKQKDFIKMMKTKNVIDARRILDPTKFKKINFAALGLGK